MSKIKKVGILGAGKLGVTVAQLALAAGYKVYIAGADSPEKIALSTSIITPGAIAVTGEEAAKQADIIVLALPLSKFRNLNPEIFEEKLVIDGMNHWYEVDGPLEETIPKGQRTTEAVQKHLSKAVVIKALNHMGYHNLRDEAKPSGAPSRKAIAVAGDDEESVQIVTEFVDALGFDPLFIGPLKDSAILETGQEAFGANLTRDELQRMVNNKS